MSSSEAYLDSLLAALSGEQNKNDEVDVTAEFTAETEPGMTESAETEPTIEEPDEVVAEEVSEYIEKTVSVSEEIVPEAEEIEELEVLTPEPEKEIEIVPVSDDPNKALGADEIAALFAQANVDMETGEEAVSEPEEIVAESEPEEIVAEPEQKKEIEITPISDDPNKALGADEIAALFAQANVDMTTGEETVSEPGEIATEAEQAEDTSISLDAMLAGMLEDEDEEAWEESVDTDVDGVSEEQADLEEQPVSLEEIEIDMDNPEELELLLGIGDKKDRVQKVQKESVVQSEDDILAAMGEENPDLNEINSLLNKLDNNELIGDGIEESVLVGFDESEYDSEQDPWLDELLGGGDAATDKKKEKKKLKFPFFGKKKKEKEPEVVRMDEESVASSADEEEIQDILSAMSQEETDIPLDLFAELGGDADDGEGLDLIAMVEADKKREAQKGDEKKGFFAKIFDALTEEIPDEEEDVFKEKKEKKGKKGKKGKAPVTDAEDNEGILEELDAEEKDGKKKKKDKKEKKPKKEKKEKKKKEELPPELFGEKRLPIKMVMRIFALCFSIMALLLLVMHFVPKMWSLADGRNAFYKQDYEKAYEELTGKDLSESDQRLYEKSKMILQLSHKMDAYENYKSMNLPVEALDALLSGYLLWQELGEKIAEYDAVSETEAIKTQIVNALSADYQITEEEAAEINMLGNYEYTLRLEEITGRLSRQNGAVMEETSATEPIETEDKKIDETAQTGEETPVEPTEDVLSEEEVE